MERYGIHVLLCEVFHSCVFFLQLIMDFYNHTYSERSGDIPGDYVLKLLQSLTNMILFPGGMIGAYGAGYLADRFGRYGCAKKG